MKKDTLTRIYNTLKDITFINKDEVLAELTKEINKGAEAKAKNAEAYEGIHDLVIGALGNAPATCGEIFDAIEDKLPEGMTKGKVQYALTHLWGDEIVVIAGKPNTYRRA